MHTLGPLNVPIQSKAVLRFLSQNLTLAFLKMASDWIGVFKGPACKKPLRPRIFVANSEIDTNCNRVKSGAKMSVFRSVSVCES